MAHAILGAVALTAMAGCSSTESDQGGEHVTSVRQNSLGVGAYFLAERNSTLDERDGICPSGKGCAPGTNAHLAVLTQQAITQQRASLAFFAVAGVTLACGAGLWFLPKRAATSDHALYLLPVAQPAGGALVWGGSL